MGEWGGMGGMFNEFNEGSFRRSRRVPSCLGGFAYSVCHAGDPFLFLPGHSMYFYHKQLEQTGPAIYSSYLHARSFPEVKDSRSMIYIYKPTSQLKHKRASLSSMMMSSIR